MVKIKAVAIILKILGNYIVHRNFGNLTYDYVRKHDTLNVEQLRKYEKTKKKIRKAELDLTFLMDCQTLNVVPKFISFLMLINAAKDVLENVEVLSVNGRRN